MKIFEPLKLHATHPIEIRFNNHGPHASYYHCLLCNKWVAWLSKKDTKKAEQLGLL